MRFSALLSLTNEHPLPLQETWGCSTLFPAKFTEQVLSTKSHPPQTSPLPKKDLIGLVTSSWQRNDFVSTLSSRAIEFAHTAVLLLTLAHALSVVHTLHAGPMKSCAQMHI
jgi:hypothetical protein